MTENHPTPTRSRLTAEERRGQILRVAHDRFTESRYAGTTTLTVATQAGVSEALVIKHFGSKEGLYRQTVVEPLLRIVEEQIARNTPNPADLEMVGPEGSPTDQRRGQDSQGSPGDRVERRSRG